MMSLCLSIGTSGWISCQLSVVSCQLSVVSGQWSVVSGRFSVFGFLWLVVGGTGDISTFSVAWESSQVRGFFFGYEYE